MTPEESGAVEAYIRRYEEQIQKRHVSLAHLFQEVTGYHPHWDPVLQDFIFVDALGSTLVRPEFPTRRTSVNRLYRWYGNKNKRKRARSDDVRPR